MTSESEKARSYFKDPTLGQGFSSHYNFLKFSSLIRWSKKNTSKKEPSAMTRACNNRQSPQAYM